MNIKYRQVSSISRTESRIPNFNVSCLVLQLSLHNLLKPVLKSRMKIYTPQKSLATLEGEIVDPEITRKIKMFDVLKVYDVQT